MFYMAIFVCALERETLSMMSENAADLNIWTGHEPRSGMPVKKGYQPETANPQSSVEPEEPRASVDTAASCSMGSRNADFVVFVLLDILGRSRVPFLVLVFAADRFDGVCGHQRSTRAIDLVSIE